MKETIEEIYSKLTPEQINAIQQKALADQKAKDLEKIEARKKYEADKNQTADNLVMKGITLHNQILAYKKECFEQKERLSKLMYETEGEEAFGKRGGFSITSENKDRRVMFKPTMNKGFNEKVDLAADKLRSVLERKVKPRSKQAFNMILALLEKKKDGTFHPDLMGQLLKMKSEIEDPEFQKAVELFEESYQLTEGKTYIILRLRKSPEHDEETVVLDFAAIPFDAEPIKLVK